MFVKKAIKMNGNVPPGADLHPRAPWRDKNNEPLVCSGCGQEVEGLDEDEQFYCDYCDDDKRAWKRSEYSYPIRRIEQERV